MQAFGDGILAGITRDYSDFVNKNGTTVIPDLAGRRDYLGLFWIIWRAADFGLGLFAFFFELFSGKKAKLPKSGTVRRAAPVGPQNLPSFVEIKPNSHHRTAFFVFARGHPGIILGLFQVRRNGRGTWDFWRNAWRPGF